MQHIENVNLMNHLTQGALSMQEQLDNFKEYKCKLVQKIGKKQTEELISKSLYVISAGTNDFIVSYITLKVRELSYSVTEYEKLIVQYVLKFTQVSNSIWLQADLGCSVCLNDSFY